MRKEELLKSKEELLKKDAELQNITLQIERTRKIVQERLKTIERLIQLTEEEEKAITEVQRLVSNLNVDSIPEVNDESPPVTEKEPEVILKEPIEGKEVLSDFKPNPDEPLIGPNGANEKAIVETFIDYTKQRKQNVPIRELAEMLFNKHGYLRKVWCKNDFDNIDPFMAFRRNVREIVDSNMDYIIEKTKAIYAV